MDESALESYFDKYIENEHQEENNEDSGKDFFDLLPDELLNYKPNLDGTAQISGSLGSISSPIQHPNLNRLTIPLTPERYRAQLVPRICNIISSVDLGCNLDLDFIASKMWNIVYDPKKFHGLIVKSRKPNSTLNFFRSGRTVCSGSKSVEESRLACRRYARKIQKLGFPVTFRNFKIRNTVASARALPLQLHQLMMAHKADCSYEPELFPTLFYKGVPGVSVSISHNGGLVVTGAKTLDDVNKVLDKISNILINFTRG